MSVDSLWIVLSAALVFLMQAGFLCLESGLVRTRNAELVAMKNFVDWVLCILLFCGVGFGLMFGPSAGGLVGTAFFGLEGLTSIPTDFDSNAIVFLFQVAFAGTAATIVSGAIAGRASFVAYLAASAVMAALVYPVVGHWAWGALFVESNDPWLARLGFVDFAGSTVVHSTGAWFALAAAWMIGPRLGRYDAAGEVKPIRSGSLQIAALGALLLWIGWWGFNGGSTLAFDVSVGGILLNTNLAGASAALTALVHGAARQGGRDLGAKLLGGALGGLVAITASCHVATPAGALFVGAIAGWLHNAAHEFLLTRCRVDDPVGAIAVHGVCGAWGTLAVALVMPAAVLDGTRLGLLGVQALGVGACFVWAAGLGAITCALIRRTLGLRLAPELEREGVDVAGRFRPDPDDVAAEEALDPEILRALMAGK